MFRSLEGGLFFEKHIEALLQVGHLLSFNWVVGRILGELGQFAYQNMLGCLRGNIDCARRRGQLPTLVVVARQRPSFLLRPPLQLPVTSRQRSQFINLNLGPALVPRGVHFLYAEMAEHNQRLTELEEIMPTERRLRIGARLTKGFFYLSGRWPDRIHDQSLRRSDRSD